jgi:hypothetical protein
MARRDGMPRRNGSGKVVDDEREVGRTPQDALEIGGPAATGRPFSVPDLEAA